MTLIGTPDKRLNDPARPQPRKPHPNGGGKPPRKRGTGNSRRGYGGGKGSSDAALGCLVLFVIICVLLPLAMAFGALITMLAWNLGVVALVAAVGGSVGKIGFFTALFVNIAVGIVGRVFHGPVSVK